MEFIENYPLSALSPADYNPRRISPEAFEVLKSSIKKFGVIKPVIVNGDKGVLTAGHQRTKAMKALGMTHTPAVKLKGIVLQDEIMFNLFHNRAEYNKSHVQIKGYGDLDVWLQFCGQ